MPLPKKLDVLLQVSCVGSADTFSSGIIDPSFRYEPEKGTHRKSTNLEDRPSSQHNMRKLLIQDGNSSVWPMC